MNAKAERAVLVVEDDVDLGDVVSMVLDAAGYSPVVAKDGREALTQLRTCRPRVILLDLMMPGMNGWELRAAQPRDPLLAKIPVVVMTGDGNAQRKAAELDAVDFLQKPIDVPKLLEVLSRHCDAKSA